MVELEQTPGKPDDKDDTREFLCVPQISTKAHVRSRGLAEFSKFLVWGFLAKSHMHAYGMFIGSKGLVWAFRAFIIR